MTVGVALYATLTGYLTNTFLTPPKTKPPAELPPDANDLKARVAQLRQWQEEQKQAQAILEAQLDEIEKLL